MPAKVLTADTKLCQEVIAQITAVNGAGVFEAPMKSAFMAAVALLSVFAMIF